jgi:hypothetical protein
LDNRKQPKSTPKLPHWALPKQRATNRAGQKSANPDGHAAQNRAAAQDAGTLRARVQALSDQVGFSLSRSVLMAVAKVRDRSRSWKPKLFERSGASARDRLQMARRVPVAHRRQILQRQRSLEKHDTR